MWGRLRSLAYATALTDAEELCSPLDNSVLPAHMLTRLRLLRQGANVHSFDPDASPAEKAAQARKAASSVAPIDMSAAPSIRGAELDRFKHDGGSSVVSDVGTQGAALPVTTGAKDAEKASSQEKDAPKLGEAERAAQIEKDEGRANDDGTKNPPGAMPAKEAEKGKPRESACFLYALVAR